MTSVGTSRVATIETMPRHARRINRCYATEASSRNIHRGLKPTARIRSLYAAEASLPKR